VIPGKVNGKGLLLTGDYNFNKVCYIAGAAIFAVGDKKNKVAGRPRRLRWCKPLCRQRAFGGGDALTTGIDAGCPV